MLPICSCVLFVVFHVVPGGVGLAGPALYMVRVSMSD